VHREESALESLDTGPEETLDFVVEIEELQTKQARQLLSDGRLPDATHSHQEYAHADNLARISLEPERCGVPF
jgi:hypothetical protein